MDTRKVLITGGSGFIGSNILHCFFKKGEELHTLVRGTTDMWRIRDIVDDIHIHIGDLSDEQQLREILSKVKPDVVINSSGAVRGFSMTDQMGVVQGNFINTVNIVNACIESNIDVFLNTGSAYECGFSNNPISEDNCQNMPIGLYGIAKRAEREYVETIARKYSKNYLTMRLFTPYGHYDSHRRLIPHIITSLILDKTPKIKNPKAGRDFIFVDDVATAFYKIALDPGLFGTRLTIDIATGKLTKVSEIASTLFEMFDKIYQSDSYGDNVEEYLYAGGNGVFDATHKLSIGMVSLEDNLKKTKEWFEKNISHYEENNGPRVSFAGDDN